MHHASSARRLVVGWTQRCWALFDDDGIPVATSGLQEEVVATARRMLRECGGEIEVRARWSDASRRLVVTPVVSDDRASVRPRRGDPWR